MAAKGAGNDTKFCFPSQFANKLILSGQDAPVAAASKMRYGVECHVGDCDVRNGHVTPMQRLQLRPIASRVAVTCAGNLPASGVLLRQRVHLDRTAQRADWQHCAHETIFRVLSRTGDTLHRSV